MHMCIVLSLPMNYCYIYIYIYIFTHNIKCMYICMYNVCVPQDRGAGHREGHRRRLIIYYNMI